MSTPQYIAQGQPVTVVQPVAQQQPIQYVPQGQQPAVVTAVPQQAGVAYYSAAQQGVVLVRPLNQPNYNYKPNDFYYVSLITLVLCGIFSPLSLVLTIPALLSSQQSRRSAKMGQIDSARQQGMAAAYFNLAAVIGALVVACICTGLVLGLYGPTYYCNNNPYSYRCPNYRYPYY